jgi:DNA-binding transcriptional LysR family regulator
MQAPPPSLRQLRYFVATAQTGSATRAAAVLGVAQPSVSAAIRELEQGLGQPLFHRRHAHGLELTGFGADRLARARAVLDAAADFAAGDAAPGRLTLGYFATLGPVWVPRAAAALRRALPGLSLGLMEGDLEQIARALDRGGVDLALTYDIGLPAAITRDTIAEMQPFAVMAAGHPLAGRAAVTLQALADYPFVLVDLPLSRDFLLVPFWQQGLAPQVMLRTRSVAMVHAMVAESDAVSVLFTPPWRDDGAGVARRPIEGIGTRQRLVVARGAGAPAAGDAAVAAIRAAVAA